MRSDGLPRVAPLRSKWLQFKNKERKLNTKKCLITIVSALLMTAVMHAQEASDLTAEKQLAQRKAELDAREKALNEREKTLAEKERATASSTSRSREKGKAKAKHQQTKAQSQEEQAKAARAEKKLHEPFSNVWTKLCWSNWARLPTRHRTRTRRTRVAFRRHRSIRHLSRRPIGRSMEHRSLAIRASLRLIR